MKMSLETKEYDREAVAVCPIGDKEISLNIDSEYVHFYARMSIERATELKDKLIIAINSAQ